MHASFERCCSARLLTSFTFNSNAIANKIKLKFYFPNNLMMFCCLCKSRLRLPGVVLAILLMLQVFSSSADSNATTGLGPSDAEVDPEVDRSELGSEPCPLEVNDIAPGSSRRCRGSITGSETTTEQEQKKPLNPEGSKISKRQVDPAQPDRTKNRTYSDGPGGVRTAAFEHAFCTGGQMIERGQGNHGFEFPVPSDLPSSEDVKKFKTTYKTLYRAFCLTAALDWAMNNWDEVQDFSGALVHAGNFALQTCQTIIKPGVPLMDFYKCIEGKANFRRNESTVPVLFIEETDKYPNVNVTFNPREFVPPTVTVTNATGSYKVTLAFTYRRLVNEDKISSLEGADPYLAEHLNPFRYHYNNQLENQRQPGWSYHGSYGPSHWHLLDNRKFYVPLHEDTNLEDIPYLPEFAQAFPGLGIIAQHFRVFDAPLSYEWDKDSGYFVYTRYPPPLIGPKDFRYFKYKKLINENLNITVKSDEDAVGEIIEGLKEVLKQLNAWDFESLTRDKLPIPYNKTYAPSQQTSNFFRNG